MARRISPFRLDKNSLRYLNKRAARQYRPSVDGLEQRVVMVTGVAQPITLYVANTGTNSIGFGLTPVTPFQTIQYAINFAQQTEVTADTIDVAAGTYREDLNIPVSLTLQGPNSSTDPNTASRSTEAIIEPATNGPDYTMASAETNINIAASNVTIAGFTIDGSNPTLSGGETLNGSSVNAATAIGNNTVDVGTITVTNNIIKDDGDFGVLLANQFANTPTDDNYVTQNLFQNIGYDPVHYGTAVYAGYNFYASITDNVMTGVRKGIQVENDSQAAPDSNFTPTASDNTVSSTSRGIWDNLHYGTASPYTISGNTVSDLNDANTPNWYGIEVSSLGGSSSATITDNTITATSVTQATSGYDFWNDTTTTTLVVSGGTDTGAIDGVTVTNYDPRYMAGGPTSVTLSDVAISGTFSGVHVYDNSADTNRDAVSVGLTDGVTITGGAVGLYLDGEHASVVGDTVANTAFNNEFRYIYLGADAMDGPVILNATAASFDGFTPGTANPTVAANLADDFAVETNLNNYLRESSVGYVELNATAVFVTSNEAIQRGINVAPSGGTVYVAAGTYVENLNIPIPLTLSGPNASINPNTATPSTEALIEPATNGPDLTTDGVIITIGASNVTIAGFTIDGSNPNLSGGISVNGTSVNAAEAMYNTADVSHITVTNNIIQDYTVDGVDLVNYFDGTPSSDNYVTNNLFNNIGYDPYEYGEAISAGYNFYLSITGNVMNGVEVGVQTDNDYLANPDSSFTPSMSNNVVNATSIGLWDNLQYESASPYTISGNTIAAVNDTDTTDTPYWYGIYVTSINGGVNATITNNTITGGAVTQQTTAYDFWNDQTTTPIVASGGSVSGVETGVFVTNYDAYFGGGAPTSISLSGVAISDTGYGVYVYDNPADVDTNPQDPNYNKPNHDAVSVGFSNGVTISGGTIGLLVEGTNASVVGETLANTAFTGQTSAYVDLSSDALAGPVTLNATAASFNGFTPGTADPTVAANLATDLAIASEIDDYLSDATIGYVELNATNVFVVAKDAIQRGINVSTSGGTVYVGAGTYVENLNIPIPLTLSGPNASINPNTQTPVAEALIEPATNGPDLATDGVIITIGASNVTIAGFTIDGSNPNLSGGISVNGTSVNAAEAMYNTADVNHITVTNNIIQDYTVDGVDLFDYPDGTPSSDNYVTNNLFNNIGYDPYHYGEAVAVGYNLYLSITGNVMNGVRVGVQTDNDYLANPDSSFTPSMSNNVVNATGIGLWDNLEYQSASPYTISGNTISDVNDTDSTDTPYWRGIYVTSINGGVNATITNNTITATPVTQQTLGYDFWNDQTTTPIVVSGGSVSGAGTGVFITNDDPRYGAGAPTSVTLSDVAISGTFSGVHVYDNPADPNRDAVSVGFSNGVTINGGFAGLYLDGENASVVGDTLANTAFSNEPYYIYLGANAMGGPVALNATAASFNGFTPGTADPTVAANLATDFALENNLNDYLHEGSVGYVELNANDVFVAANRDDIQSGINVAPSGGTVYVQAGTYTDQLIIGKSLTITGQGSGTTTVNIPFNLTTIDGVKSLVTFDGSGTTSSIGGLTLNGPGGSGTTVNYGIYAENGATVTIHDDSILNISDNTGDGIGVGVGSSTSTGTATLTNDVISGYQTDGVLVNGSGSTATIQSSTITGAGSNASSSQVGLLVLEGSVNLNASTITNNATGIGIEPTGSNTATVTVDQPLTTPASTVTSNVNGAHGAIISGANASLVLAVAPTATFASGTPTVTNNADGTYNAVFNFSGSDNITSSNDLVYSYRLDSGSTTTTTDPLTLTNLSAGSHTLYLTVTDQGGLSSTVSSTFTNVLSLTNGSFEAVQLGNGGYAYNQTGASWTFSGSSGVAANNSPFTASNPPAPDGDQVAFIQAQGSFSQVVSGFAAGTYTISFQAAQRANNGTAAGNISQEDFEITIDGVVVGTYKPVNGTYQSITTPSFTVTSGTHTIAFVGLDSAGGDNTALIDLVSVSQVPQSSALANGSFEAVQLGNGGYAYNQTGASWTFSGSSGVAANNSPFTASNPSAPDGNQVAFIQAQGSFSQVISGYTAGTYTISFRDAQRANGGTAAGNISQEDFEVTIDGVVVGTFQPSSGNYQVNTTSQFTLTSGTHTIAFVGLDSAGGDNTALIDLVSLSQVVQSTTLANVGFEAVQVGNGGYAYNQAGASWTFSGSSGVAANNSPFTASNPPAPDGDQVAFIQGQGSFSQVISGYTAGTYTISFQAAQRANMGTGAGKISQEDFEVTVDGVVVGTFDPAGGSYQSLVTASFSLTAGTHTIAFIGLDSAGGDNTALIDSVSLSMGTPPPSVPNGSFESVQLGYGGFVYAPTNASWTFTGGSGISANGSAFTANNPPAPDGNQVGFIQGQGSSFSESVTGFAAGSYTISFEDAQRLSGGNPQNEDFEVTVDGIVIGTFDPTSGTYQGVTSASFSVSAGAHTIAFVGLDTVGGDNTAFIDNITIAAAQ